MRKYIKPLLLALIFGISACGVKGSPHQGITPPAIGVMVTRENCTSMETQVGMTVAWTNGDTVHLPLQIDLYDESGKVTDIGKSEIGPGDTFSVNFYHPGVYHFYCSEENKDVYGTITVK